MTAGTGSTTRFYVAVRLWELIGRSGKTLSAIADELPLTLNTPELRLDCDEARKFAIVAEVAERLRRRGDEVIDIDGVHVKSPDGW